MSRSPIGATAGWAARTAAVSVALAVAMAGCGSSQQRPTSSPAVTRSAARAFLDGYVDADGRVVRRDQGGDTVSEGQAYALLLDVASGDRSQFAEVWTWSRAHLLRPDGLLAYHWQDGRVADVNSASDADLDVARALILAGSVWHDATWTRQGTAYATAILANETATVGGRLWLVAGPWARQLPLYANPSYGDPAAFEVLAAATHDPRWTRLLGSSAQVIAADTDDGHRLPSDWAQIDSSGAAQPSAPPGGGPTRYGYDAFRTLVRQSESCRTGTGRRIAAVEAPLAAETASPTNRADTYNTDATPSQSGDNPLMLVAAAGSAGAAGDTSRVTGYLGQAASAAQRHPSYYLDAWVALGRALLTTSALSPSALSPPGSTACAP